MKKHRKVPIRSQKRFGWRPDHPDRRDRLFMHEEHLKSIELPSKVDLGQWMPPVLNQGNLGACFSGDTMIPLMNGNTKSIKELAEGGEGKEFWVYSVKENGRIISAKASAAKTGLNKELVKIVLDNNKEITCTPDHKFLLRDGSYLQAKDLIPGVHSLMPLKRMINEKGYELTFGNDTGKWHYTHWLSKTAHNIKNNNIEGYNNIVASGKKLGGRASLVFQAMKFGKEVLEKKNNINHDTWDEIRSSYVTMKPINRNGKYYEKSYNRKIKYETALKLFETKEDFVEACMNYNHKILSIEYLSEKEDVYCLTVPGIENFALDAGVFVHNCTAHGITEALRFNIIKGNKPDVALSRLQLYFDERKVEGTTRDDAGAEIRDGVKCAATIGVGPETDWPYDITKFKIRPPAQCYTDAKAHEALVYERVAVDLIALKTALASGFPVIIGISVYESFESEEVAKTGIVPMPGEYEEIIGGHCLCCFGYDDAKQAFLVRNSWGDSWGDKGNCWIPYNFLGSEQFGSDYWIVKSVGTAK